MSIVLNNGVQNIKGTPGIITADFATAPAANFVAIGTIWIDSVSLNILQSDGNNWNTIGGAGSIPNLSQVLTAGNTATDLDFTLEDSVTLTETYVSGSAISIVKFPAVRTTFYYNFWEIIDNSVAQRITRIYPDYIYFEETVSNQKAYLYPNLTYAGQIARLPESSGTISLQDPPLQASINTTPFTPSGNYNKIYRVIAGASSIILNPANWVDRKTLTFCGDVTYTFSAAGGATLRGQAFINATGLVYVTYLSSANTFYISHI